MNKKIQEAVPFQNEKGQENSASGFWNRNAFLFNLRAGFGITFGLLFFVCAMLFTLQMEQRLDADPEVCAEIMIVFVVLMHLMSGWFWFCVLDKWVGHSEEMDVWLLISVIAFVLFIIAGAITLAAFVSYCCEFLWENQDQWWRVLPLLCVILSLGRMIYKIKAQDRAKK